MRIGVLGGTFDPLHVGHLTAAIEVRHRLGLDTVLLVTAASPWQKAGRGDIAPAELRHRGVVAAVESLDGLEASRIELDRNGPTFSVDTLIHLRAAHPGAELFLILGEDTAAGISSWHEPGRITELAELVVVNRPGARHSLELPDINGIWHRVDIPALDISSTQLRARARAGEPVDVLIPKPALDVYRSAGLYPVVKGHQL